MFPPGPDREAARQWGHLAGLWHDLGKFALEWQEYLKTKADPHQADATGTVDHSTAGAKLAVQAIPLLGHLLAYPIAGHHSGLLDAKTNGASCQEARLRKQDLPSITNAPASVIDSEIPAPPSFIVDSIKRDRKENAYISSFFTRMFFSCLVDADFIATEAFMNRQQAAHRNKLPEKYIEKIDTLLEAKIESFGKPSCDDPVNLQRAQVVEDCRKQATQAPGLFTLTVPTGGGKTLSSLLFALKHARQHGQERVIYVVPFTSIIEQNAEVIREIVAPLQTEAFTPLIEHHSSLSPEKETEQGRLATENWDAPLVITTAVQFFESLHAAKTSRCRKLHNIANAVVILDEAQTFPVNFLKPSLRSIQELTTRYSTSIVLCTATQPAIAYHKSEFPIGLKGYREIIQDPASLFAALKRVTVSTLGPQTDEQIANRLTCHAQALCIVNRRKHAQELYKKIAPGGNAYHLSALMCTEHRSEILNTIRIRLKDKRPIRLVSTQLIEAGVDVDFPVVYRSLAGLDSIAQAAGRCNRNGRLLDSRSGDPVQGQTYIFTAEDQKGEAYFRETAQVTAQLLDEHSDLLSPEAIHHYFDLYYYQQKARWDEKQILQNYRLDGAQPNLPFHFNFQSVSENFRLIDSWQVPVLIPYDSKAEDLIAQLRNEAIPLNRTLLRGLQRYVVQISPRLLDEHRQAFEPFRDEQFFALISTELNYSADFGLALDEEHSGNQLLNVDE
jgi:CRISPR-associated endonuclease/helicase Cas3